MNKLLHSFMQVGYGAQPLQLMVKLDIGSADPEHRAMTMGTIIANARRALLQAWAMV